MKFPNANLQGRRFCGINPALLANFLACAVNTCLASVVGIIDKEFFCQDCELTWPKDAKAPWSSKHGAPYYFIGDVPAVNPAPGSQART